MANYGTTQRLNTISSSPSSPISQDHEHKQKRAKNLPFTSPVSIPSTPEAATSRVVRNMVNLSLYYAIFIWTVLLITLIPARKVSLVYLVVMTEITFLYHLLLQAMPNSALLHKVIDKRFVLFVLFVVTANMLILTEAGVHLFATLGGTLPVVMVHAVLWRSEEGYASGEELVPLVQQGNGAQVGNFV